MVARRNCKGESGANSGIRQYQAACWNRRVSSLRAAQVEHLAGSLLFYQIIDESPFRTYISLETFTHRFPQPSIIARFEMATGRNASAPLTILGAHQDSANCKKRPGEPVVLTGS